MIYRFGQTRFAATSVTVSCLCFFITCHSRAQDYVAGVRGGSSFESTDYRFYQVEAFAGRNLPWRWNFYSAWFFQPTADLSAGLLSDGHKDAFIGELGVNLELHYGKFPVSIEVGFSPTILSDYHFGGKDFGEDLQFTSDIGITWNVTDQFTIGCRIQHMSNGRIAEPNPGLDIGALTASFRF